MDKQNNYDKENIKKIIDYEYEKIYLFDNKLPSLLKDLIGYDKMQLCFLNDYIVGKDEKLIYLELENYAEKKIVNKNMHISINYRLEQYKNLEQIEKNVYLKNNMENNLYDTILTFGFD